MLVSLVLLLRVFSYPSLYWHFNNALTPGPGITLINPSKAQIISPGGTLIMKQSEQFYATVDPAMVFGGASTWVLRFYTIGNPARWSRLIDFGNGPGVDNIFIAFDSNPGSINFHFFDSQAQEWEFLCEKTLWNPNAWNIVIVTIGPGVVIISGNDQFCSWEDTWQDFFGTVGPIPSIPYISRGRQYIGRSNYDGLGSEFNDPFWDGEVDFIWYLPRTVQLDEANLFLDAEFIGTALGFQSLDAPDSRIRLINSPDLTGDVLNLDGNNSQGAVINPIFDIFGPTSFAARVRLDSFQNWSRLVDLSSSVTNDSITVSTSPENGITWTIEGAQQWSMSCTDFWQLGQWMDVVLTVTGADGAIYGNGVQCGKSSDMSDPLVISDLSYIGKSRDGSDPGWDGAIEYVMYWNRALSAHEAAYISAERSTLNPWIVTHFSSTSWDPLFSGTAQLVNGKAVLAESQYVQVDSTAVQLASPFTVSMYVQLDTSQPSGMLMDFSNGLDYSNGSTADNVAIAVAGMSNDLQFIVGDQVVIQCDNFFTVEDWTQVTLTHDGTTASVYRDGNLMCSNSTSPVIGEIRSMQVLGTPPNSTANFGVSFDYFMIFNWSFSETEAAAMLGAWDRYFTTCAAFVPDDPRVDTGTCGDFGRAGTTCNLACKPLFTPVNPSHGTCDTILGAERASWTGQYLRCVNTSDEVIGVIAVNTTSCLVSGGFVYDCPTMGNVTIVIHAIYLSNAGFTGFISGLPCEFLPPLINISNPNGISDYYFSCILPPGTGFNRSVVLTADGRYSKPQNLLSYAAPVITSITGGCNNTEQLAVKQCARGGSETLTILGLDFGPDGASVSIGGVRCIKTTHDSTTPHNRVVCTTPPGYGAGLAVQLFQSAGPISLEDATLDYTQCSPGYFQNGTQTACGVCSPGYYSSAVGQLSCARCDPGRYAPQNGLEGCFACPVGSSQSSSGMSECYQCNPGFYAALESAVTCLACDPGTNATFYGSPRCDSCPAGSVSEKNGTVGPTSCTLCKSGTFSGSSLQSLCQTCPVGKYSGEGSSSCTECDPGYYQGNQGESKCLACSPGSYSAVAGRNECVLCDSGTASNRANATSCDVCEKGKVSKRDSGSTQGLTVCTDCEIGRFMPTTGQFLCLTCTPGSYANKTGMIACPLCDPGYYQSNGSSSECIPCSPGTAVNAYGQFACLQCTVGTFSTKFGAVECSDCPPSTFQGNPSQSSCELCSVGTANGFYRQKLCGSCSSNTVSTQQGMSVCTSCQANSSPNENHTRCDCNPGFYKADNATRACIPCPLGTVCSLTGLTSQEGLPIQNGYYLTDRENLKYQKCLSPKNCVSGKCENHRTGLLCSRCQAGYSMSEWTKECTACGTTSASRAAMAFTIIGLLIAVLVLYGYIIVTALKSTAQLEAQQAEPKSAPNSLSSFFTTYRGREADERQYNPNNARAPSSSSSPGSSAAVRSSLPTLVVSPNPPQIDASVVMQQAGEKNDRQQISDNTYVMKIIVNFFQVASSLTSLPIAGAIAFPTYYMQFLTFFKFLSIDLIPWQNVGCLFPSFHVYTKIVTLTLVPLLMIGLLAIVVAVTAHFDVRDLADSDEGRTKRKKIRLVFLRGVIFTMFMLYPIISSAVLSHFSCLTVGRQDLLLADFSIVCYTQEWRKWTPFAAVMTVIYPIGIPVTFFVLLARNRKNLGAPLVTLGLGFLYESYAREVWWFEVLVMLQKLALTSLLQLLPLNMQLGAGAVVATAFLITLVLVQPELRVRNWVLHMLANVEIVLLLLLWHFSYKENITTAPIEIDAAASALFILLTVILAVLLFLDVLRWLKGKAQFYLRRKNKAMTAK